MKLNTKFDINEVVEIEVDERPSRPCECGLNSVPYDIEQKVLKEAHIEEINIAKDTINYVVRFNKSGSRYQYPEDRLKKYKDKKDV